MKQATEKQIMASLHWSASVVDVKIDARRGGIAPFSVTCYGVDRGLIGGAYAYSREEAQQIKRRYLRQAKAARKQLGIPEPLRGVSPGGAQK